MGYKYYYSGEVFWTNFCGINVFFKVGIDTNNVWPDGYVKVFELATKKNKKTEYEMVRWNKRTDMALNQSKDKCLVAKTKGHFVNNWTNPPILAKIEKWKGKGQLVRQISIEINEDMPIYKLAEINGLNPQPGRYFGFLIGHFDAMKYVLQGEYKYKPLKIKELPIELMSLDA